MLQGVEVVSIDDRLAQIRNGGGPDDDGDETMEDVEGHGDGSHNRGGSGGAGPDATGGDVRHEGAGARDGGADGGRA